MTHLRKPNVAASNRWVVRLFSRNNHNRRNQSSHTAPSASSLSSSSWQMSLFVSYVVILVNIIVT